MNGNKKDTYSKNKVTISIRVTPMEKQKITREAEKLNLSANEYARDLVLGGDKKLILNPQFMKLLGELSQYANETNDKQIGKVVEKLWKNLK